MQTGTPNCPYINPTIQIAFVKKYLIFSKKKVSSTVSHIGRWWSIGTDYRKKVLKQLPVE